MAPEGWKIISLGKVMEFKNGLNFTKADSGQLIKIVRVSDFQNHSELKDLNNLEVINISKIRDGELLTDGDLLFVRSNGNKNLIGRCLFFPKVNERVSFSGFTIRGRANKKFVMPEFVAELARSSLMKQQISRNGGGTNISNLSQQILNDIVLALPPIIEQKKIAKILSTWDKAIATTEELLENSQKQKQALMQQLLTGKKRFPEYNEHWVTYMLEELEDIGWLELGRGNVISKTDIENHPGDNPIYSSSIKNQGLMGNYAHWMFDEELISWSVDGGGNFFYRHKHKFSITNVSGWMRVDTTKLNYKFLAYQLSFLHEKLKFDYQSKAHPSVIRKLYKLNIPTLPEQERIASILSVADKHINSLEEKINFFKVEKKALMQQLLTGKKRVKPEG